MDPPGPGPRNMAVDHALAACLVPGTAVFRIYRWSCPTVSFGRNEPASDHYDSAAGRRVGVEFVRRPTGGRAVLHDQELTYAAVLPVRTLGAGLRATYGLINRGLVGAMRSLGVPAVMAEGRSSRGGRRLPARPDSGPCFDTPAPGEVTVAGRKLVGSAQARLEGAILQHGSVLVGPGQERLLELASTSARVIGGEDAAEPPGPPPVRAAISLEEVLGHTPPWSHLVEAVIAGVRSAMGGGWEPDELTEAERVKAMELTERYSSPEWTWRR